MIHIQQNPPETIVHFENPQGYDTLVPEKVLKVNCTTIIGSLCAYSVLKKDYDFSASLIPDSSSNSLCHYSFHNWDFSKITTLDETQTFTFVIYSGYYMRSYYRWGLMDAYSKFCPHLKQENTDVFENETEKQYLINLLSQHTNKRNASKIIDGFFDKGYELFMSINLLNYAYFCHHLFNRLTINGPQMRLIQKELEKAKCKSS